MTITVWVCIRPREWWIRTFELPPDACALVEAGLRSLISYIQHPNYVQDIYWIGGHGQEYVFMFAGCI